jgi:LEA14-like dessication related protein
LLLAVALLAGCSSLSLRPQPPEVQLEGISAAAIGPGGARARIRLAARNPNGYDLSITSLDYMLSLDGRSVGGGTLVQPVVLVAQDTTGFDLDVRVDLRALGTVIDRATRRGTVPYELTGDLVLGDGTRLPFHRVGDFQPLGKVQDTGAGKGASQP